jgi:ABC-type phosphate transport system substrate-binding protein
MKKILLPLIAVLLLASNAFAADGNVVIIANKSVPVSSITSATLKLIYLGKKNTWSDGSAIVPVALQSGSTHEAFLGQFIEKSSAQYSSFWKQAIFTGEGTPPRSFASFAEMASYVANTPGAIGYVAAGTSVEDVKILRIE